MGHFEAEASVSVEWKVEKPSFVSLISNFFLRGQCKVGSLTGAVASQRVTEAFEGKFRLDGNQLKSVMA